MSDVDSYIQQTDVSTFRSYLGWALFALTLIAVGLFVWGERVRKRMRQDKLQASGRKRSIRLLRRKGSE